MRVRTAAFGGWIWYIGDKEPQFDKHKCGKWMYFFDDRAFVERICAEAIKTGAILECKHTDGPSGVTCFYLECDDIEAHKRILHFFLDNNLIRRTKKGRLYNIGFKLDDQTRAGQYGTDFQTEIKLDKFVNLETGEWIYGKE